MEEKIFEILTYFIIYSFFGWIMESTVRTVSEKKIINTGFLKGPFCPIYGIGAIIMLLFLERFQDKPILLFFIAITLLTIWEYIVGVLLEKMFHTKYWDYSKHKFNLQGRVCLTNSICWGILGVVFVKYIHPFIEECVLNIDKTLLYYVISILTVALIVDFITTVVRVKNIKVTLQKIEELNKQIKEKLKEIKKLTEEAELNSEKILNAEKMKRFVEKLDKKKKKTILHLYRNVYRLKKAFPAIDTKEITEVLNRKIETIKNRKNT